MGRKRRRVVTRLLRDTHASLGSGIHEKPLIQRSSSANLYCILPTVMWRYRLCTDSILQEMVALGKIPQVTPIAKALQFTRNKEIAA
jgi:hypothetical protein